MALLEFCVLGAQKAGTTTLHEHLVSLGLSLPRIKETHFYSDGARRAQGQAWYRAQFPEQLTHPVGEVDPDYLSNHEALSLLREEQGDLPVVALLRDPFARAVSQHGMSVLRGQEHRSAAEALLASLDQDAHRDDSASADYVWRSLYGHHLEQVRSLFSQVLVVRQDELLCDDHSVFRSVLAHIGADPELANGLDLGRRTNERAVARFGWLTGALYGSQRRHPLRRVGRHLVPGRDARRWLRDRVETLNRRQVTAPPDEVEVPPAVARRLLEDLARLDGAVRTDDWVDRLTVATQA